MLLTDTIPALNKSALFTVIVAVEFSLFHFIEPLIKLSSENSMTKVFKVSVSSAKVAKFARSANVVCSANSDCAVKSADLACPASVTLMSTVWPPTPLLSNCPVTSPRKTTEKLFCSWVAVVALPTTLPTKRFAVTSLKLASVGVLLWLLTWFKLSALSFRTVIKNALILITYKGI